MYISEDWSLVCSGNSPEETVNLSKEYIEYVLFTIY